MNKVILMGNLGQDPEIKYSQAGNAILNMRLATTERRKVGDQWEDHTEWHSIVMFGKRAESLNRILNKGDKICAEGRLQTRSWEDKEGNKRYSTEIIVDDVELAGGGKRGGGDSDPRRNRDDLDDIPF